MATLEALRERARELGASLWGALEEGGTEGAGAGRLAAFHGLISRLRAEAAKLPPSALLRLTFKETGYGPHLGGEEEEGDNAKARLENVEALVDKAASFDALGPAGLRALVDEASLASDADRLGEARAVSLMTLHNAKGLEFDSVYVVGVEEGLLPHRGLESDDEDTAPDVEEERRLLYVGMTRARQRLVLSYARRRRFLGRELDQGPSRFLDDIPEALSRRSEERKDDEQGVRSFFGVAAPAAAAPAPTPPRERGEARFRAGSRVRHPEYGPGHVLSSEGSGDSLKVVVRFDRAGRKKLVAKFAGLTAIK
jgi:DNA helicase-2/ATP-dependent DNA helicase PcrA